MSLISELLAASRVYEEKTGRARSGAAATVLNDSKFFDRIEDGAGCTVDTYEKLMLWFRKNTPTHNGTHKAKGGRRQ